MQPKALITVLLLGFVAVSVGFLVYSEMNAAPPVAEPAEPVALAPVGAEPVAQIAPPDVTTQPAAASHEVIAYYFHNTQRCMTCLKIERLAEEALREAYPEAFADGLLVWKAVNMEDAPNQHYAIDYGLVTSSLVLVDRHAGEEREWTVLEQVWQLVHEDESAFKAYVVDEARLFLES
jgi:hypothetical protein